MCVRGQWHTESIYWSFSPWKWHFLASIAVKTGAWPLIFCLQYRLESPWYFWKDHSVNCFVYVGEGSPCMDSAANQLAFGSLSGYASPGMLSSKILSLVSKNIWHHLKSTAAFDSVIISRSSESQRLIKTTQRSFLNFFCNFLVFECMQCPFLLFLWDKVIKRQIASSVVL